MPRSRILQNVSDEYFSGKDTTQRYWKELQRRFNGEVLPALGRYRLVSAVTKKDVRNLLEKKKKYPAAARTMYDGLRPFFRWCIHNDYLSSSPVEGILPPKPPESRDRVLTPVEIQKIWKATETGYFSSFYRLLLLTGQRRNEVAGITINEIQGDHWVIPKERTKGKSSTIVPLSSLAREELSRAQFIGKGLSGFSKSKAELDRRSGVSNWRIHDLRRTCASYLAFLGTDEGIIERILNHRVPGVRGVYNRYLYLPEKTEALEKWCKYIISLTGQ